MKRRILITGASGRLGGTLTRALAADHEVAQLSLEPPTHAQQQHVGPIITGSITDRSLVGEALEGVDTVIHCASYPGAIEPFDRLMDTNVIGTFVVLEEAGRRDHVERFVYLSTVQWHGLHEHHGGRQLPLFLPITEDHPSLATGYYDVSKVLAEHLCRVYVKRFRKPAVAMRPGWIITEDLEPRFKAVPPTEEPHLNDYVGSSDLVTATRLLLDYNPPDGFDAFLFHAADQRSTCPSVELVRRFFPGIPADDAKLNLCDGFGALVDCTKAQERLGWQPAFCCQRDPGGGI